MSARIWKDRVRDILDAVVETAVFLSGMDFESFCKDAKTVKAVTANLTIIGEAARHVPDDVVQLHPELPWPLMRGMRNRLGYSCANRLSAAKFVGFAAYLGFFRA